MPHVEPFAPRVEGGVNPEMRTPKGIPSGPDVHIYRFCGPGCHMAGHEAAPKRPHPRNRPFLGDVAHFQESWRGMASTRPTLPIKRIIHKRLGWPDIPCATGLFPPRAEAAI